MESTTTRIPPEAAVTLDGLFRERVRRSPEGIAYRYHDRRSGWRDLTWEAMATEVARWQAGMRQEALVAGDRVALLLRNGPEWVAFDQAALGLGLVVVPLYVEDRPENSAYILRHAEVKLLLVQEERHWRRLAPELETESPLRRVLLLQGDEAQDRRVRPVSTWLPAEGEPVTGSGDGGALATIVYTSGTTGRPKGVMLSHRNIISNAAACLALEPFSADDRFLSFLPLSHMLERTGGYYLPMMAGAQVVYARTIQQLAEDLRTQRPTVLIAVPRVFEQVYGRLQQQLARRSPLARALFRLTLWVGWRRFLARQGRGRAWPERWLWPLLRPLVAAPIHARLGGRLRLAVSGGAALQPVVARCFLSLGLDLVQGYGLTESGPVVSVSTPWANDPASVGQPLPGVEVRLGEGQELLVRGPSVMQGYWRDPEASAAVLDEAGWLHTGDQVRIEAGRLYITGRLKEILVLSNGEKVAPADVESSITLDPLFTHVMLLGEGRPYLAALLALDPEEWRGFAASEGFDSDAAGSLQDPKLLRAVRHRANAALAHLPGYAKIRRVALTLDAWDVENGLLTPTMKLRRAAVQQRYAELLHTLYH